MPRQPLQRPLSPTPPLPLPPGQSVTGSPQPRMSPRGHGTRGAGQGLAGTPRGTRRARWGQMAERPARLGDTAVSEDSPPPRRGQLASCPGVVTAPPQRCAAAGLPHCSPSPRRLPGDPWSRRQLPIVSGHVLAPLPDPASPQGPGAVQGRGVPRMGVPPSCARGGDGRLRSSGLPGCRPRTGLPWGAAGFYSAHPKTFCFFFYFAFLIVISCGENSLLGSIPSAGGLAAANVTDGTFSPHQNLFSRALLK